MQPWFDLSTIHASEDFKKALSQKPEKSHAGYASLSAAADVVCMVWELQEQGKCNDDVTTKLAEAKSALQKAAGSISMAADLDGTVSLSREAFSMNRRESSMLKKDLPERAKKSVLELNQALQNLNTALEGAIVNNEMVLDDKLLDSFSDKMVDFRKSKNQFVHAEKNDNRKKGR